MSRLQSEARNVFKVVSNLHQEGHSLEAPAVNRDVAIGSKIPVQELLCCVTQLIANCAGSTASWRISAAAKESLPDLPALPSEAFLDHPFALQLISCPDAHGAMLCCAAACRCC